MEELDRLVRNFKTSMVFEEDGILVVNYKGCSWKKKDGKWIKVCKHVPMYCWKQYNCDSSICKICEYGPYGAIVCSKCGLVLKRLYY